MNRYRSLFAVGSAALATALAVSVSACGAEVESADSATISVTNCGVQQHYPSPKAAVAYDVSAIEKMFALGLTDRMRGIVMPKTVTSAIAKSPYRDDYAKVETISEDVLAQEPIVAAKADWVSAGWKSGFSAERGITPDSLERLGIHSYVQEETCYEHGPQHPGTPLEATYADLINLGTIFQVPDRARTLVDSMKAKEASLRERAARKTLHPKLFVYDLGTDEPFTVGNQAAAHTVIELAGARSVTGNLRSRWTSVGWESVVAAQPDGIVVVDYNKQPVAEKIEYLRTASPLRNSPAVVNNRIHVIDYGAMMAGPRNLDTATELADYLESTGLSR